ncbi:MAG: NUDIX domain-containing protein [Candidatus Thiodiazotropha lotti]|uniref:Nudix hydrolase domain-containing protein n=1 Tax=Candidatus Thiodiazotropha endoloripes TaxID=1818881 RepID=A0A1E2UUD0_9GAMM|nr:NUDIX domain-containing protein [Candidatus Thiodiazotropha endoloripes]MCG7899825.1 NUDIX domain-containing protein [Candidatus Thiodiazotropha weberae]MCG7993772.1 NUDIX domain-containing protein [Candidatus Thiodiazotropha lotti]MCG7904575.1 NUDIX domain-containing protein [Candidatus Thiodiazotropha weberae]MCG7915413.1 NUDIX domain-containing protein [Candidatus Thiodiazotropha weberae]MCG8001679.1 NUDIX domain-containing protein [Candidatus Thiodiazotropha lotti]
MRQASELIGLDANIRNAVRAVIVRDKAILMQKKWQQERGFWYTLPGGGQEVQESLTQALQRECEEEIGTSVVVDGLLAVADFYKQRRTEPPSSRHLIEFLFACSVPDDYRPGPGAHPDKHQIEVVWLPFAEFSQVELFPKSLEYDLQPVLQGEKPLYLGVID